MKRTTLIALGLTFMLSASAQASAGDFTIPAAWEGIWEITETLRDCGTTGGETTVEPDTLCAGDPIFVQEPDFPPIEFTGTVTDTEVHIVGTGTEDLGLGCVATVTITIDAVRTGETYTAIEEIRIEYSAECVGLPDFCEEADVSGVRTDPDPVDCDLVPVEPKSWSEVKTVFR